MPEQPTPDTPLIAAFTAMSGLVGTGERALELTEEFGRRFERHLRNLHIPAVWTRTGIIGTIQAPFADVSAVIILRLVGEHDDRWEWQFWTTARNDAEAWPALLELHQHLVELVTAWEETEDVDAVVAFDRDYPGFR
jgi:hypothetical protein